MPLDMLKLCRILELGMLPVQLPHPLMQRRVSTANIPNIALKVLDIHRVKPNDRHKQTDINLRQHIAEPVRPAAGSKMLLGTIESLEESSDVPFVRGGFGSEARLVDAVVD
jgi:hypothetical protein